jgi:TRAP-type mannitol/chloroaromatic compound transport system permease large subunit
MEITAMVFLILIGAAVFSLVFRGFGGEELVHHFFASLPGGATSALLVVMLVIFLLGFILDFIEITFVVVPIVGPILLTMGVDPLWLGIMIAMNLQTSFLTPPFGFALFYLRSVAPPTVKTTDIYWGAIPFVCIQIIMVAIIIIFPNIVSYGDPEARAKTEQSAPVDLDTMMMQSPDGGDSGGEQKDGGEAEMLKNLQSDK